MCNRLARILGSGIVGMFRSVFCGEEGAHSQLGKEMETPLLTE